MFWPWPLWQKVSLLSSPVSMLVTQMSLLLMKPIKFGSPEQILGSMRVPELWLLISTGFMGEVCTKTQSEYNRIIWMFKKAWALIPQRITKAQIICRSTKMCRFLSSKVSRFSLISAESRSLGSISQVYNRSDGHLNITIYIITGNSSNCVNNNNNASVLCNAEGLTKLPVNSQ